MESFKVVIDLIILLGNCLLHTQETYLLIDGTDHSTEIYNDNHAICIATI